VQTCVIVEFRAYFSQVTKEQNLHSYHYQEDQ